MPQRHTGEISLGVGPAPDDRRVRPALTDGLYRVVPPGGDAAAPKPAATPDKPDGFAVLRIEPERALVIGAPSLLPGGSDPPDAPPWRTTWAFVLEPIGEDATRLVVRVRADYQPGPMMALVAPIMRAVHEVMERQQLRNLRRRAEAAAAPGAP